MLPSMDTSQSPGDGKRITTWFCHGYMAVQVSSAIIDTKLRSESWQRSFSLFPFSCWFQHMAEGMTSVIPFFKLLRSDFFEYKGNVKAISI